MKSNKKDNERNLTVANWMFGQTTHVVGLNQILRAGSSEGSSRDDM